VLHSAYEFLKHQPEHATDQTGAETEATNLGNPFSEDALRTFFLPRVVHGLDDAAGVDADVLATFLLVSASWAEPYKRIVSCVVNRPTKKFVKERITSLEVGRAAAFWLRPQNTMLHIERRAADSARLSAWRVQLPPAEVMGMRPPEQCVPSAATDVEWKRIANPGFYKLVAELAEVELKESKTRGRYEPNAPAVIMDYLLPVCCGKSVDLTVHVWKKAPWPLQHYSLNSLNTCFRSHMRIILCELYFWSFVQCVFLFQGCCARPLPWGVPQGEG
jgi:hypothetical protein